MSKNSTTSFFDPRRTYTEYEVADVLRCSREVAVEFIRGCKHVSPVRGRYLVSGRHLQQRVEDEADFDNEEKAAARRQSAGNKPKVAS